MTTLDEWPEIENPWLTGTLGFVTWILTAALFGVVFGESIAEAVDISTVVGALAFAAVVVYFKRRSSGRSTSN